MKRIKSAPANIAEMVNRKKTISEKPTPIVVLFTAQQKKNISPLKNKIVYSTTQKKIKKTLNNIMLDYLDTSKQQFNTNDEEVVILSILYYYICEKVFTKKNLTEFMLFIVQIFIKYLFSHKIHELIMNYNGELIINKIMFIDWIHPLG